MKSIIESSQALKIGSGSRRRRVRASRSRASSRKIPAVTLSSDSSALGEIPGYDPKRDAGDCWFDADAAQRALDFFPECLNHVEGELADTPFYLSAYQLPIIGNLFGWKRLDGTRRYRTVFIEVAAKSGKTPLAAAIALYLWICDREAGAQVINFSYTREMALLLWRWTRGFVDKDSELSKRVKVYTAAHSMQLKSDINSTFRTLALEERSAHGLNLHGAVCDELHAIKDEGLISVIKTRFSSRRQPVLVFITTAGWDRNSVCYKEYQYACRVRDGAEGYCDPSYLPVIYEAHPDDEWTDEATWAKANPNLGISVKLDALRSECEQAQKSPSFENTFKQVHLNLWTEQAVRFYKMSDWDGAEPRRELDSLKGEVCYAGLDLAQSKDLAGLTLVFPAPDGAFDVFCWAWIPEETAREHEKIDRVPYREWSKMGLVELTPGDVIDHRYISECILDINERFRMVELAFDPLGATQLITPLEQDHRILCVKISQQSWSIYSEPMNLTLTLTHTGKLRHGGNPLLRWQAGNVAARVSKFDPNVVRPYKAKSSGRIDNMAALYMALSRAIVHGNEFSYYAQGGKVFTL